MKLHTPSFVRLLQNKPSVQRLGVLLSFGALIFDGTYNALAKGLTAYLSPVPLLVLSELLTAVFVVFTQGLVPLMRLLLRFKPKSLLMAFSVGLLSSGLAPLLWYKGLSQTTAINASILSSADIFFVLLFGRLFLNETINRMQAIGAGVVLVGILIVNFGPVSQPLAAHVGDILIVLATGAFAAGTVVFKKYLTNEDPEVALFIRCISGVFLVSIVSVFIGHSLVHEITSFPMQKFVSLLAFAFFSRFLNLVFFYGSLDRLPATSVSLIQNAGPLTGMLFAALILGEQIQSYHILGAVIIILGLFVEQLSTDIAARLTGKLLRFDFSYQPE